MNEEPKNTLDAQPRRMKRTSAERAFDILIIERLFLKSLPYDKIVERFAEERGYKLSRTQIHNEIKVLRKRWEDEAIEMISTAKAEALRLLKKKEEELWEAWEKSKMDATRQTLTKTVRGKKGEGDEPGAAGQTQQAVKQSSCGDPAYMRLLLDCQRERARIMGYDAPVKQELSGPNGAPIEVVSSDMSDAEQEAVLMRHLERTRTRNERTAKRAEQPQEAAAPTGAAQTDGPA